MPKEAGNEPKIHVWVLDVRAGLIKDLGITFENSDQLPAIYKFESQAVLD